MIGSGIPNIQSSTPLPMPMLVPSVFAAQRPASVTTSEERNRSRRCLELAEGNAEMPGTHRRIRR